MSVDAESGSPCGSPISKNPVKTGDATGGKAKIAISQS